MTLIYLVNIVVYHIGLSQGLTDNLSLGVVVMDLALLLTKPLNQTYRFLGFLMVYGLAESIAREVYTLEGALYWIIMVVVGWMCAVSVNYK